MKIESTFKDKSFEKLILKENEINGAEVFSFIYKEKKYWVKKARSTSSSFLHKNCHKLMSFDFLLPVEDKNATKSMIFETDKLINFKKYGINVANVTGRNDFLFVLEDSGINIYHYLKKKDVKDEEKFLLLNEAIALLAKIHNNNFYHGGAQIRNFTHVNGEVYTIDLEDSFDLSVDLKTLQFRDLFLFLLSLLKLKNRFTFDFNDVIYRYINLTGNVDFINRFKKVSKRLFIFIPLCKPFKKFLAKDVNNFIELLEILNNLEKK